jgi:hypothetical protein
MMAVLVFPNGRRENHVLSGAPHVGDFIRLQDARPADPDLKVERVTWVEVDSMLTDPSVVLSVRPWGNGQGD